MALLNLSSDAPSHAAPEGPAEPSATPREDAALAERTFQVMLRLQRQQAGGVTGDIQCVEITPSLPPSPPSSPDGSDL